MPIRLPVVLIVLSMLAACVRDGRLPEDRSAPKPSAAVSTLKLADWNMEFVAERNGGGCHPRTEADYAALRRTVSAIDADVFAFEEVENEAAAARVFDTSRYSIVMERRAGAPGGSCGGGRPGQIFIRQAVGIAIRKGLPFERLADVTALQLGNPNLRSGVDVIVRPAGSTPFRVLAVHLKSGCFQGRLGGACPTILGQMPILRDWVRAASTDGARFAIMGDWNRRLALPNDLFWREIDGAGAARAGLVLTDAGTRPRCDPRYADFIDDIVLDSQTGVLASGFAETTFAPGADPSDHCPVSITVKL